ncbi:MAG: hypothetical protein AAB223_06045, partial [Pseudomonadota bacterium]
FSMSQTAVAFGIRGRAIVSKFLSVAECAYIPSRKAAGQTWKRGLAKKKFKEIPPSGACPAAEAAKINDRALDPPPGL